MAGQEVPDLEKASSVGCEEHGHTTRAPGSRGQAEGGGVQ